MARPFKFWLSLGLFTQVAIAIVVVAAALLGTLLPNLNADVTYQQRMLSKAAAAQINRFLGSFSSELELLSDDISSQRTLTSAQLQDMLDTVAYVQKGIEVLYVVDASDQVVAVGLPKQDRKQRENQAGLDFSGRSFAVKARDTQQKVWSDTYLSARGNIVVALAIPLNIHGQVGGKKSARHVLVGELNLNEVSSFAGFISERDNLLTVIVDRRGNVVGHPDSERALRQESLKNFVSMGAGENAAIQRFRFDSINYLSYVTPVPETGWVALVGRPVDKAYAAVRSALWSLAVGCAVALGVTMIVVLWLSQCLSKRVKAFAGRIDAVARGDLGVAIPPSPIDEIEHLSRNISSMANAVIEREAQLRESESRFRTLVENVPQGIALIGKDERFVLINPAFSQLSGYTLKDIHNLQEWWACVCPDAQMFVQAIDRWQLQVAAAHEKPPVPRTYKLRRAEGALREVEIIAERLPDERMLLTFVDVTEKRMEDARRQRAANVFSHAREGIMIMDPEGIIVEINDAFSRITGYTHAEIVGKNHLLLRSDLQDDDFYRLMWQKLEKEGVWFGEVWNRAKDGQLYAALTDVTVVRDNEGAVQNYVALFTDITQMKEYQRQLERAEHYDALTGLPNRVLLADRLRQAMILSLRRGSSLAVLYLDLDGFKEINDLNGRVLGDKLLLGISHRLKEVLRDGDTLSRIGGDEFVAVLGDLEQENDCLPIIERLLQAASQPLLIDERQLAVSVSIGLTYYPRDRSEADLLMRHADQAMYQAKQNGKNQYAVFDVMQDEASVQLQRLIEKLRDAMAHQELVLYYQPKVNLRTKTLIGAEALIRWQHPVLGLLAPAEFLPPIAEHPISIELGEWVIHQALKQIGAWSSEGLCIPISVNIGARQLLAASFKARLIDLLAKHPEVSPSLLELEILETSALEDLDQVSALMFDCVNLGVGFALDDFGTGYSSLTYLKRLPAAVLKIDQSFVRGMLEDQNDFAIVNGVIGLAHAFKRQVIAEGVETTEHGECLLKLGCEQVQGYGIAKPMSAQDFMRWAANWPR